MKRIAIIAPASLPIPAVRGGAVETLVELFIKQNEKEKLAELMIVSPFDAAAFKASKCYHNTEFLWYHNRGLYAKFKNALLHRIICPLFHKDFVDDNFSQIIRKLKKKACDHIIMESRSEMINILGNVFGQEKVICHIHIRPQMSPDMYRGCDRVLAVSQYIKDEIVANTNTPPEKIVVLSNCVDTDVFHPSMENRNLTRGKYSLSEDEVAICFVGRLVENKGIGILLKAMEKLKSGKKYRMFVVGALSGHFSSVDDKPTPFVYALISMAARLDGKVVFTGYIDNNELPVFLNGMDIAVMPSLYKEAASVSNLEFQAVGLPVITTDMGGIPEYVNEHSAVIVENDCYLATSLAMALDTLIENEEQRKMMGQYGLDNSKRFSSNLYLESLLAALQ